MRSVITKTCVASALMLAALVGPEGTASAQLTGPSTTQSAYALPSPGWQTKSILSVGDTIGGYRMVGIPDGLGAFDNNDGTFTVLMNHELGNTVGAPRAHNNVPTGKGAFVSKWVINKSTLQVISGADLMQQVIPWDIPTQASTPTASTTTTPAVDKMPFSFNRFCSGDLPAVSAFFNPASGLGTQERIYMHGEEGATGYQQATVVTGPEAGKSYVLGKFNLSTNTPSPTSTAVGAWENSLANPFAQSKTIVANNSDGGSTGIMNNSVSVYVGTKQAAGTEADKAGLTNGLLYFVSIPGITTEISNTTTRATSIPQDAHFDLSQTAATSFSRPEDGAWNPLNLSEFYFVTTDQLDQVSDGLGAQVGQTRLWRLTFTDITQPELGGTIRLVIDGRTVGGEKVNMFDNITINPTTGIILLDEDVGGAPHNGKVWSYNPATDVLTRILNHDPARFGNVVGGVTTAATAPFNNDEEMSGVLDVSSILGPNTYLSSDQAHYGINAANPRGFTNPDELVEGGQLMLIRALATPSVPALPNAWWLALFATLVTVTGMMFVRRTRVAAR